MLDKIILGFLSLKELTAYDIKKAMEQSISHFYAASFGSIHPALVKLEKIGSVTSREITDKGRSKKIYTINDAGRAEFAAWLEDDIAVTRMKEDSLVKVFFFGMLEPKSRKRIVSNYIQAIDGFISELQELKKKFSAVDVPEHFHEIARYQIETLRFGIDHGGYLQKWFSDFLENHTDTMEENND